jgi:hypothetical protein
MIRLLNDGGLRRPIQPRRRIKQIKGFGEPHEALDPAEAEIHHIDILA